MPLCSFYKEYKALKVLSVKYLKIVAKSVVKVIRYNRFKF